MLRSSVFSLLLLLPVGPLRAGDPAKQPVPAAPDPPASGGRSHFQMSGGWMWRSIGGVRFVSGSRAGSLDLPSLFGASGGHEPGIGPRDAYGARFYEDGYVGVDEGTANDGSTSLWGYQSTSQVSDGEIRYHANGSRRTVGAGRATDAPREWQGEDSGNAPVLQLDWWHEITPVVSAGVQLQWSLLNLDTTRRGSDFSAWQRRTDFDSSFTDTYDLHGIIVPDAPYQGAGYGYGPLLDNIPRSRASGEKTSSGASALYTNDIRQSLDLSVNTLSLGPTAACRSGRLTLQGGAGFALNIASWDADQQEVLILSRNGRPRQEVRKWRSHSSGTDLLSGLYVQGGAGWQISERFSVSGFARYEWSESLEGSVGPSRFSVDLTGWAVGGVIGFQF